MKRLTVIVVSIVTILAVGLLFFWGGCRDLALEKSTRSNITIRVYYVIPSLYYRITGFGEFIIESTKGETKKRLEPGVSYDFRGSAVWSWTETAEGGGMLEERYYAMKIEVSPEGELRMIKAPNTNSGG